MTTNIPSVTITTVDCKFYHLEITYISFKADTYIGNILQYSSTNTVFAVFDLASFFFFVRLMENATGLL
jgi:hypothetical protein